MNRSIFRFSALKNHKVQLAVVLLASILLTSCISLDREIPGTVNTVEKINGVSLMMDRAVDKHLALALRNDSDEPKKVMIRPVGGDIGFNNGKTGSMMNFNTSGGYVKAAYLITENDFILESGREILVDIFLRNWYLTTRDFTTKVRVDVLDGDERHRIVIEVSQNDVFDDPGKMIRDNKMGRNDPSSYASVHVGVDSLPATFMLTIPVSQ